MVLVMACTACTGCEDDIPNQPNTNPPKEVSHPAPTKTVVGAGTLKSKSYKTTVIIGR